MKDRLAVDLSVSVREGSPAMSDSLGMWWPRDVVITSEDGDIELDKATLSDDTSSARRWLERPVFPLPPPFLPDFVKSGGTDCAAGTGLLAGKLDDVLFNLAGLMMCCWCFGRWDTLLGEMCRLVLVGDLTWDVVFGRTEPLVDYLQFFFLMKTKTENQWIWNRKWYQPAVAWQTGLYARPAFPEATRRTLAAAPVVIVLCIGRRSEPPLPGQPIRWWNAAGRCAGD